MANGTRVVCVLAALTLGSASQAGIVDIQFVELFKLFDRVDGVPIPNPYGFEACVGGFGVMGGTITLPDTITQHTLTQDPGEHDFCFFQQFATKMALDTAFPGGIYSFSIDTGVGTDSKDVAFDAVEPLGWLDVTSPLHKATDVPDDVDLNVTWTLQGKPSCTPGVDCGQEIGFFLIDQAQDTDVDEQMLPITTTSTTVSNSLLAPGTTYDIELETYNGTVDFTGSVTTDIGNDPIDLISIYEDINITRFTTVPEPVAVLLQLAALTTVAGLALRRRRPTA